MLDTTIAHFFISLTVAQLNLYNMPLTPFKKQVSISLFTGKKEIEVG
jgi:hypothetical protein